MKAVVRRLNALPDRLMKQAKQAAVAAAAQAAQTARELAPLDTGALRQSISHSAADDGAVVTASAPHAAMVEYGTSKMPPRPFMLPAARAAAQAFFETAGIHER